MKLTLDIPLLCEPNLRPHLQHVFDGEYDVALPPDTYVILDIGANVGAFALWALHRWPGSVVHAYEPHPETFKILTHNTLLYPGLQLSNVGIGDPGMRILANGKTNSGEASFYEIEGHPFPTGQHVMVESPLTLPRADIIKIDTEGCEAEILIPLLAEGRKFKAILFEWHSEQLRRGLDNLLADYVLVGAEVAHRGRGTSNYLHKDLVP